MRRHDSRKTEGEPLQVSQSTQRNGDVGMADTAPEQAARRQPIPRPDVSVAQVILLVLAKTGSATLTQIQSHAEAKSLGALRSENSFYTAIARLKRRRSVTRIGSRYELTNAGELVALKAYVRRELAELEKQRAKNEKMQIERWDGKWRIAFFDVPERKRSIRDYMRNLLRRVGFVEFQRSMWAYPHRVPSFLSRLLSDPQFRSYARLVTTSDIDYDEDLRRRFHLK